MAAVRKLIGDKSWAVIQQGLDLLEQQKDPVLWEVLNEGIWISGPDYIAVPEESEIHKRVRQDHRNRVMLVAVAHSPQAGQVEKISLTSEPGFPFEVLERFPNLKSLSVYLRGGTPFDVLVRLKNLKELSVTWSGQSNELEWLLGLESLESLELRDWKTLTDLGVLARLPKLRKLNIASAKALVDLTPLEGLAIEELDIRWGSAITDLSPLSKMPSLKSLMLADLPAGAGLSPLIGCPVLESLSITHQAPPDLGRVTQIPTLKTLRLASIKSGLDMNFLAGNTTIQALELELWEGSLAMIHHAGLKSLHVSALGPVDMTGLVGHAEIEDLRLTSVKTMLEFSDLGESPALKSLYLSSCAFLHDISALAKCTRLEHLYMSSCGELKDITPLFELPALTKLDIGFSSVPREQFAVVEARIKQNLEG